MSAPRTHLQSLLLPAVLALLAFTAAAQFEEAKLMASDATEHDGLGVAVAISGERALLGTPNAGAVISGLAYLYERQPTGAWSEIAKLAPSDPAFLQGFGVAVALSGERALVGADGDQEPGLSVGSAHVFEAQGGAWIETAELRPNDVPPGGSVGFAGQAQSVALWGDRALVGAWSDSTLGYQSGAAYVFERQTDGSWLQAAKLVASTGAAHDRAGWSVALWGERALLGAYKDNGDVPGSAYLFERGAGGSWSQVAELQAAEGIPWNDFGMSVALEEERALVGATRQPSEGENSGAAYVFERQADGSWPQTAELQPLDPAVWTEFGHRVSLSGNRALATRFSGLFPGVDSAAYVFTRSSDGAWSQTAKLLNPDPPHYALYGALSGSLALVGAPDNDEAALDAGAAFVFELEPLKGAPSALSVAAGGTQSLTLHAGADNAFGLYGMLTTTAGTAPGIPLPPSSLTLPLNPSPLLLFTFLHPNLLVQDSLAFLDGNGQAAATLTLPPGLDPGLAGLTLHHAYLLLELVNFTATFVSNPLELALLP